MSNITLSILGLYNFDDSIFSDMTVPEGVDKELAVNSILTDCAELEILYPNPEFMKTMIKIWSARELPIWTRLYNAEQVEYNPIENYDRQQTDQEINNGTGSGTQSATSSGTQNVLHKYAAFDSGTLADQTQDNGTTGSTESANQSTSVRNQRDFTSRIHGNIGVTTSQQMLESELALAPKLSIINYIVESFKQKFCILVY